MITLVLTTLCLAGTACILFAGYRIASHSRKQLLILNAHRIGARSAIQKSRMDLAEVRNRARLLEDTVSGGASAVEKVHKAIANTTFGLIDMFSKDEDFRDSARRARQSHEEKSQQVYKAVRTTNRALHILADTLIIGKAEKRIVSKTKKAP
ncbi:MAG: hypothetical protein HLUCCX14_03175 [Marinobacter excellens HL-55]|uniref:Uncharacterized protein n=1 Tax=Marinobacter excellens HL-55 TaxID=1305731 RepID=A0A0P8BP27_9GAMM|nr:MAG: hypothetical protein HLUCCX14_03175 [Marinobacter excellens HL-55]